MKIWIISSWSETLSLFKFLGKYAHEYVVYYDFFHWPYGDKTFEQSLACVQSWIDYLIKQKVDAIILPPVYELYIMQNTEFKTQKKKILPLFTTYVHEYCFAHSLVGKIGLVWDFADVEVAEKLFTTTEKLYLPSAAQQNIKKFHFPFAYRTKELPLRKHYLNDFSYSNILVNKIIKFDLRYFKDAMVDTLIPLNYGYFYYQTTISKFLNFKKIRFHSLEKLEKVFEWLMIDKWITETHYSVTVAYTWHPEFLKREKRLLWLLQKWKNIEVTWTKIS